MKKKERVEIRDRNVFIWGNFKEVIKTLLIFITVLVMLGHFGTIVTEEISGDRLAYNKCTQACSQDNYQGYKIGFDKSSSSCIVEEYDVTPCIESCNIMYLEILE